MIKHIAIIMDGNGRWATSRGLQRSEGHKAAAESVRAVITRCCELEVPYLTLYTLSRENLLRPEDEVSQLFSLLVAFIKSELLELMKQGIRVHIIGDIKSLPFATQQALNYAINKTKNGKKLQLCLAIAYSAREEIARAMKKIVGQGQDIQKMDINEIVKEISHNLDAPNFCEPDLIIRTGGELRLSNFLLYQSAYSELYFTPVYFPDFNADELDKALDDFNGRQRRFGKTEAQIKNIPTIKNMTEKEV